jgi:hypothetical protein
VADREFMFALDLSDRAAFEEMLDDVARNVLGYVGYGCDVTGDLVALLHAARSQGGVGGPQHCRVQFSAHAGQLHVVVSDGGGREWRTSRPLP